MPRFVKIDQDDGSILLINTDYVVKARYTSHGGFGRMTHFIYMDVVIAGALEDYRIDFESKYAAIEFLEKNFLLFNS